MANNLNRTFDIFMIFIFKWFTIISQPVNAIGGPQEYFYNIMKFKV